MSRKPKKNVLLASFSKDWQTIADSTKHLVETGQLSQEGKIEMQNHLSNIEILLKELKEKNMERE